MSFSFAERTEFPKEHLVARESHSEKVKLPSGAREDEDEGGKRASEKESEGYYRDVIDKKKKTIKKRNMITIDSNSISIFFYQLYFSNYICTLNS